MRRYEAEHVLGLDAPYDKTEVRKAARAAMKRYHPDFAERNGISADEAAKKYPKIQPAEQLLTSLFDGMEEGHKFTPLTEDPDAAASSSSTSSSSSSSTSSQSGRSTGRGTTSQTTSQTGSQTGSRGKTSGQANRQRRQRKTQRQTSSENTTPPGSNGNRSQGQGKKKRKKSQTQAAPPPPPEPTPAERVRDMSYKVADTLHNLGKHKRGISWAVAAWIAFNLFANVGIVGQKTDVMALLEQDPSLAAMLAAMLVFALEEAVFGLLGRIVGGICDWWATQIDHKKPIPTSITKAAIWLVWGLWQLTGWVLTRI